MRSFRQRLQKLEDKAHARSQSAEWNMQTDPAYLALAADERHAIDAVSEKLQPFLPDSLSAGLAILSNAELDMLEDFYTASDFGKQDEEHHGR